jgi:integrase/recombinase XerD
MFNQLFFRSDALTRQLSAPLVDERRRYLSKCASQGMSRGSLRAKSLLLLSIVEHLKLGHRPKDRISLAEIKDAERRWARHTLPSVKSRYVEESRASFITLAVGWLSFLNLFHATVKPPTVGDGLLSEFRKSMSEDRGLSPKTVEHRCAAVRPFLDQLLDEKQSLATITVRDVDSLLLKKVNEGHYARVSVRAYLR